MMIPRTVAQELTPMLSWFPVVSVTGPRQSGKSTLIKNMLLDYEYVNLEDETTRISAIDDPVGFIRSHGAKLIIDEAQHAPVSYTHLRAHET